MTRLCDSGMTTGGAAVSPSPCIVPEQRQGFLDLFAREDVRKQGRRVRVVLEKMNSVHCFIWSLVTWSGSGGKLGSGGRLGSSRFNFSTIAARSHAAFLRLVAL